MAGRNVLEGALSLHDPIAVAARCRALISEAERHPPDAPNLFSEGAAAEAERLAGLALDTLADDERAGDLWLLRANALRLLGRARDKETLAAYERARDRCREGWRVLFDVGLFHKWRGRWEDALLAAEGAVEQCPQPHRGMHWNVAIAATALGLGDCARAAWSAVGIETTVTRGGLPAITQPLPPTRVRVPVRGEGGPVPERAWSFEVLRVAPLSPCHGVVESPAFRSAPCDYGDVVLWDGAPVAWFSEPAGAEPKSPVFPLLEVLRRGDERRFRFVAFEQSEGDLNVLAATLGEAGHLFQQRAELGAGGTGERLQRFARREPTEGHHLVYGVLVLRSGTDLSDLAREIERSAAGDGKFQIVIPALFEAIGDTARAGREHQAWRGLERTAKRRRGGVG